MITERYDGLACTEAEADRESMRSRGRREAQKEKERHTER